MSLRSKMGRRSFRSPSHRANRQLLPSKCWQPVPTQGAAKRNTSVGLAGAVMASNSAGDFLDLINRTARAIPHQIERFIRRPPDESFRLNGFEHAAVDVVGRSDAIA